MKDATLGVLCDPHSHQWLPLLNAPLTALQVSSMNSCTPGTLPAMAQRSQWLFLPSAHCSSQAEMGIESQRPHSKVLSLFGDEGSTGQWRETLLRCTVAHTVLLPGPILASDPFAQDATPYRCHLHQQLQESPGQGVCRQNAPGHHEQARVSRHSGEFLPRHLCTRVGKA